MFSGHDNPRTATFLDDWDSDDGSIHLCDTEESQENVNVETTEGSCKNDNTIGENGFLEENLVHRHRCRVIVMSDDDEWTSKLEVATLLIQVSLVAVITALL